MALISKLRSLGAATMLCLCGAADATTYLVAPCGQDGWSGVLPVCAAPDGPKLTIQAAIDAALDGDSILVYPGVYAEQIDFDGKAISLVLTGGRDVTFIDGAGSGPVVTCNSLEGADTVLPGFTIVGGGAMSVSQSGTDPTGCQFADNTAFGGGALASEASTIDATSCDLNDNTSETDGGGTEPSTSPTCWPCRRHGVCAPRRAARLISTRTGRSTRSTCC